MNALQIFNHSRFGQIRMLEVDGKPYAVGSDVAKMLEYAIPHKAVRDHCRGVLTWNVPHPQASSKGIEVLIIPEGDIYRLIVKAADQSRNPEIRAKAEEVEKWIFDEVIPTIRKHGAYLTPEKIEEVLLNPDTIIHLATALKAEQEKNRQLSIANMQKDQVISELQPKATYYDLVLQNKNLLSVTQIAKDYGLSAKALNQILSEEKVQFRQGDCWLLYQKYAQRGYTQSKTQVLDEGRSKLHTYWTQKGRLFIYDLLKNKRGILPIMERQIAS